jgi:ATP-dependent DNA ligase
MKNYLEIEPGRAKSKSERVVGELMDDRLWVAEEKMDGWRFLTHFGGDLERAFMTGRRISDVTGRFSEKGMCAECLWPKWDDVGYTVIDGEVMPPDGSGFRDLAGIMNVDPELARARIAEIGTPIYYAFDILFLDGQDVRGKSWLERKHLLTKLVPELDNRHIRLLEHSESKQSLYDTIIARGGEGVILKDTLADYGEGWVKVKREATLDVVVTGFTEARFGVSGKFFGQVGAAKVSVFNARGESVEVAQVSGMDDATRRDMTDNPGRWIGSVIEISAYKWAKDRLQHPRFKRHRPEADPKSATFGKMMKDLGETVVEEKGAKQCLLF